LSGPRERVESRPLQLVEGVVDDGGGVRRVLDLVHREVEHGVVAIRGAEEAGEVFEPHVLAHPARPAHRRVKEPVRQLLRVWSCICPNKIQNITKHVYTKFQVQTHFQ
jgi:hypothetical protein